MKEILEDEIREEFSVIGVVDGVPSFVGCFTRAEAATQLDRLSKADPPWSDLQAQRREVQIGAWEDIDLTGVESER